MSKSGNISHLISEEQEVKNFIINSNENNNNLSNIINAQTNLTKKYKIDELNYLKDDIMQYFKEKFEGYSTKLYEYLIKINKIEKNFEDMTEKINLNYNEIVHSQAIMQSELDKVKNYDSFSNNVNDKLISHEVRLNNFREEFSKATQKYDKIYLDNLELPGYIGRCAKYKNCQIFFNEIIKNLGTLNQFREKNILDWKSYKEKLENIIKSFNILVDNNNQAQIKYINSLNQKNITDCKNMLEIIEEKIRDVKVDNAKYSLDIMKKTEEMNKKWDRIDNIKDEILEEFDKRSNEFKKMNNDTLDRFDEFKKEYKIIRDKFFELADFIKDIRFQKNIKNIYSQILYRKNIKNICKSLNELDEVKNNNKREEKDLELIKNISSIERMNFKINKSNTFEQNVNISQDIPHDDLNEYIQNRKHNIKKSVEYNSPYEYNKVSRNDRISLTKGNKTFECIERTNNIHKEIKNCTIYSYSNNNKEDNDKEKDTDKEESKSNIFNNYIKKKGNQKIIIESKFDSSISSINKAIKKSNNEDSNSLALDNQSTNANYNNSNTANELNNNINYSFSPVSAFCLNNSNTNHNNSNNNKNIITKDIRIENNDKVIKEMSPELEQSTTKKDYKSLDKKKEKIEPVNLNKTIKEENEKEKKNLDSSYANNSNNKKDIYKNNLRNSRKFNNESDKSFKSFSSLNKEKNELILYGNNPKAIDKKFFMTDKKLLDLEEFTKDKFIEIKNQIEKLKEIKPDNNQQKTIKSNISTYNSYREKGNSLINNAKNENNTSFTNNMSNKLKFLNQKINENKSERKNLENKQKAFDLTCQNFKKSKFYNLEQVNQKIFNSSCKKIKTNSNDEKEKNLVSPKTKQFVKNRLISRNDLSVLEHKKSDNNIFFEKKKWETIDNAKIKNNENKKQKNRNISSGNIYLTQKNGENVSFNEADIKLVYLNKFVNNKLPYAPNEAFIGEKK